MRKVVINGRIIDVTGEGYDPKGEFTGGVDRHDQHFNLMMKAAALCNNSVLDRGSVSITGLFRGMAKGQPAREWSVLEIPPRERSWLWLRKPACGGKGWKQKS